MRREVENLTIVVVCVAIIIIPFILGLKSLGENNNNHYEECKIKTDDLEWCYKIFNPNL